VARSRARVSAGGDVCRCRADMVGIAPFGASPPSFLRMILSENRTPLFAIMRCCRGRILLAWWCGRTRTRRRAARTIFYFVIAGLDPAIHARPRLAGICRPCLVRRASAWATGSGPVVTNQGQVAREKMCLSRRPIPPAHRGRIAERPVNRGARSARRTSNRPQARARARATRK
jgi:hypothetical protein